MNIIKNIQNEEWWWCYNLLINLKKIREERGLTLKQLSIKTGISTSYLSDLELLNRTNPNYKIVDRLLKVLNVSLEELEGKNE